MILFELGENSGKPKSRQISDLLADRMKSGILKPGDRLPSTRKLADMLRVNRSTVAPAYQTLWSLGFVELRRGRLLRCAAGHPCRRLRNGNRKAPSTGTGSPPPPQVTCTAVPLSGPFNAGPLPLGTGSPSNICGWIPAFSRWNTFGPASEEPSGRKGPPCWGTGIPVATKAFGRQSPTAWEPTASL